MGCEAGFLAEESNCDVLNDAVFARNTAAEERFNIKLDYISDSYDSLKNKVSQSVTAGEDYYQQLCQHIIDAYAVYYDKVEAEAYDLPNLNALVYDGIALKQKGTRDEASIEMIDFVMSTRIYDFGYIHDGWKGFGFLLENRVRADDAGFASYYTSNIKAVQAHYDSVFEVFEDYES